MLPWRLQVTKFLQSLFLSRSVLPPSLRLSLFLKINQKNIFQGELTQSLPSRDLNLTSGLCPGAGGFRVNSATRGPVFLVRGNEPRGPVWLGRCGRPPAALVARIPTPTPTPTPTRGNPGALATVSGGNLVTASGVNRPGWTPPPVTSWALCRRLQDARPRPHGDSRLLAPRELGRRRLQSVQEQEGVLRRRVHVAEGAPAHVPVLGSGEAGRRHLAPERPPRRRKAPG